MKAITGFFLCASASLRFKWFFAALFFLAAVAATPVQAQGFSGDSRQGGATISFAPETIIRFSKKVEKALAAKGARVAILARMGRPLSELPEGMHFTHAAFAVYSEITTRDGRKIPGYALHNLYQNATRPDTSSLVQDYPVDFFAGVAVLEAGVIIPSPELQQRLLAVITSPSYQALHEPQYSAIANPYNLGRQNCTEFVLDVVNAAIYQTDDIRKIKSAEKQYFKAQKVNISPLKLMFGAMFTSEVSLADQPGEPVTATFEAISAYLARYDQGSESFIVRMDR
ncbi:MAG: DUF2145 domain-containing protein [Rhodocyclaceae bacterium]|nr:DUF2145 domain-containing protein [Rhodocyclaceae bacterium]